MAAAQSSASWSRTSGRLAVGALAGFGLDGACDREGLAVAVEVRVAPTEAKDLADPAAGGEHEVDDIRHVARRLGARAVGGDPAAYCGADLRQILDAQRLGLLLGPVHAAGAAGEPVEPARSGLAEPQPADGGKDEVVEDAAVLVDRGLLDPALGLELIDPEVSEVDQPGAGVTRSPAGVVRSDSASRSARSAAALLVPLAVTRRVC